MIKTLQIITLAICVVVIGGCGLLPSSSEDIANKLDSLSPAWFVMESDDEKIVYHQTVENPSSGSMLATYLVLPAGSDEVPVVMLIPGGTDYGTKAIGEDLKSERELIDEGYGYAYFDPDGRGESEGDEDANGFIHQDGLLAVSLAVAAHERVDEAQMGIASYSFGIAMVSGMLGRYPDEHPYSWYVDWEGPTTYLDVTFDCNPPSTAHRLLKVSCDDEDYWSERSAANYLDDITIPYLRLQNRNDHVQSDNLHAIEAINTATNGDSPWTRINLEEPNQTYSSSNPPAYFEKMTNTMYLAILEMFELF